MPMDKTRYPHNWNEISLSIRNRAKQLCEQCDAPNGVGIRRHKRFPERWITDEHWRTLPQSEKGAWKKVIKCVLTVHHIGVRKADGTSGDPHDKMDCRPENLIALCQRCHLVADLPHRKTAHWLKYNRYQRRAGQMELW